MAIDDDLQKHTLNLYRGDYDKLKTYYPETGAGAIIRRIVRKFLERIETEGDGVDIDLRIDL